jgi:alpha/beta hydrolase family protein
VQTQGNSWSPTLRALLVALDAWADRGVEPPKSNYPTPEDKTLVSLADARAAFPAIPGVKFPTVINELALPNFGPGFKSTGGRVSPQPPMLGARYQLYVPKPDKDGLDIAGIRTMEVAAPTATLTGWALRAPGHRENDLCGLSGSFIPFAQTKAARQAGDPRLSFEERYSDQAGFVKAVAEASRKLVRERFLLQEDADRYIQAASGIVISSKTQ